MADGRADDCRVFRRELEVHHNLPCDRCKGVALVALVEAERCKAVALPKKFEKAPKSESLILVECPLLPANFEAITRRPGVRVSSFAKLPGELFDLGPAEVCWRQTLGCSLFIVLRILFGHAPNMTSLQEADRDAYSPMPAAQAGFPLRIS